MRRSAVKIEVVLLDVFAMIGFAVRQPEQALLQNRIATIPECQRETELLLVIAVPRQSILAPVICARSGLIVTEIVPRVAVFAVVLADRAPLPLAEVRPPFLPWDLLFKSVISTVSVL